MLSKLLWQSAPKPSQSASLIEGSQPRESIYLISMASFPNFGDELIAARWLRFLAQHRPEADIWLDVREPGTATSLFKGLHPRLHVTNTLFRAIHEHVTGGNRTPAELVAELGSPKFDAGLVDFRQADTVHLLGGRFYQRYLAPQRFACRCHESSSRNFWCPPLRHWARAYAAHY